MEEIYVSCDCETDGPIPGPHSLLSFGCAAFKADKTLVGTFSANLETLPGAAGHPATLAWWETQPEAWAKCREQLQPPETAMRAFLDWLKALPGRPVFVAYPVGFDFMFIYWYLLRFCGESPFAHSALDIKTYAMALMHSPYRESGKEHMPPRWFDEVPFTHVALDDAVSQGRLFCNMLAENLKSQGGETRRAAFVDRMRGQAKVLYDRFASRYWVTWGIDVPETHRAYLQKFFARLAPGGLILSAACGAGRFDGLLLEAGFRVVGIDQSDGILARARERFPQVQYQEMALHEMRFQEEFEGVICMDAMEHICPEDYPGILRGFQQALKPGGILYFSADRLEDPDFDMEECYVQAKARGLPVVYGEVADDEAYEQAIRDPDAPDALTDRGVYHYYPPLGLVRAWIRQAGFAIEEEGAGSGLHHFLARKC